MSTKAAKSRASFRYAPEDLKPRDVSADEAFADEFIARNRDALNEDLKASRASIKAGRGKRYASSEKLAADVLTKLRRSGRRI